VLVGAGSEACQEPLGLLGYVGRLWNLTTKPMVGFKD
jgi:hypothetical protein